MHQVGVVKDAAFRQARTQRVWIDGAVLARRRRDLLAKLGDQLVERVRAGSPLEPAQWPELEEQLIELDELEGDIAEAASRSHETSPAVSAALGRARASREDSARRPEDLRVWRPFAAGEASNAEARPDALSGVSNETGPLAEPARPRGERRTAGLSAGMGGGIAFGGDVPGDSDSDSDDDLAAYMHEDDVPGDPHR